MKFEDYQLRHEIVETLRQNGIEDCTDIQKESIPHVLEGRDISGLSQTGSGKTFAFLIPLFDRLLRSFDEGSTDELDQKRRFSSWNKGHFILILSPTRELADQIHKNVLLLSKNTPIKSVLVYGGVDYDKQTKALADGVDIVVGTPGRLIDLYKGHHLNFRQIKAIVFDEADRMFDMGFKDDMVYVLQRAPKDRQILLFSATLNFDVTNTIYQFGSLPVELNISKDQVKAGEVDDEIFHIGESEKPQYLLSLLKKAAPKQTIIFSNYKSNVERISAFLSKNGVPAVGISSLLTQNQRERVLSQFKNDSERNTLVATDVAARGLDIKGVDLVINYDLPDDSENYIHRIGRTGRAGTKGRAFSLVSDRDVMALGRIEDYLKQKVDIGWLDEADILQDFSPMLDDNYRRQSRVRKTGLAAVKSSQGERKPRDSKRRPPQDRPHKRRSQSSTQEKRYSSSQMDSTAPVHRDRKTGRHKQQHQQQDSRFAETKRQKKTSSYKKKTHTQPSGKKSLRRSSKHKATNQNIGQKVTSFLKGLFK